MGTNEIIVCGLLPIERELLKFEGKCRGCLHNGSHMEGDEWIQFCYKYNKRLKSEKNNCKDWLLDTS